MTDADPAPAPTVRGARPRPATPVRLVATLAPALALAVALISGWGVAQEVTLERSVAARGDDAEEFLDENAAGGYEPGEIDNNTRYLELTFSEKWDTDQAIGLVFRDLDIPADATVTSAVIEFTPYDADRDAQLSGVGYGAGSFDATVALADTTTFDDDGFPNQGGNVDGPYGLISGLSTLPTTASWTVDGAAWGPDAPQRTVDLAPLLSAWLELPGYTPGDNAAVFRLTSDGSDAANYAVATSERGASESGGAARPPTLIVRYLPPGQTAPEPETPEPETPMPEAPEPEAPEPAPAEPEAPEPAPAEPEAPEPEAPAVPAPEAETPAPTEEPAPPATQRRERFALEAVGGSGVRGSVLLSAYPSAPVVVAVALSERNGVQLDALRVDLTRSCEPGAERLLPLESFSRTSPISVTQLEIGIATLRLSGFGVTVSDAAGDAPIACAVLQR